MDKPPYKCASVDVVNMDDEVTFYVLTIVMDTGWEIELDLVMVNNPNEYCHEKSMNKSKESGKGVCVRV